MVRSRVTIKDVAAAANLTPTAVSRALRDKPDISADTKKRVRAIASELGYVGNSTARALRKGRTHQVAVVYDNLFNPYFSIMTGYLQESLKKYGYSFVTFTQPSSMMDEETFISIVSRNVDGIISFLEPSDGLDALVVSYGIPVILIGRKTDCEHIDYIDTDSKKGGELAARHLVECGCRRIAYLSESGITCARDRYEGFKQELERQNLFDESLVVWLEGRSTDEKLRAFIAAKNSFDGLFCFNDLLAFDALYLLEQLGIDGVRVVGFDNIQDAIHIPHQLTTIGSDKKQICEVAVEVLLYRIENEHTHSFSKLHDVYLVKGETT